MRLPKPTAKFGTNQSQYGFEIFFSLKLEMAGTFKMRNPSFRTDLRLEWLMLNYLFGSTGSVEH